MIQGFADATTEALFEKKPVRKIPVELATQAARRLAYLHAATRIEDLYQPPSNGFHKVGKRFAIKVNAQWRITFSWTPSGPADVLFEDYH
jgi:proteic killer suppression protein